jgi:UDP-N-acetylglucosamine 2-epimerase (non-hydrolysing)
MKKEICFVLGTRPEIIKLCPLIKEAMRQGLSFFIIHTGQHYDYVLDSIFFNELKLPNPDYGLKVHAKTQGAQTGKMIEAIEEVLIARKPCVVVVQGDTNSSLAGALAAVKLHIPVAHVEAGLRSYDKTMPEEVNRILIDHSSAILFAPTEISRKCLLAEGIKDEQIYVTGNTIVEALGENIDLAEMKSNILSTLKLENKKYILVTVHRQENVDNRNRFESIINALGRIAEMKDCVVLYPMHPRAKKMIAEFGIVMPKLIQAIEPLGYFDFLLLEKNTGLIITDSGGLQEEACILHVPCITVRDNTERPETVLCGANIIVGTKEENICNAIINQQNKKREWKQPFGEQGSISVKMKEVLMRFMV